MSEPSETPKWEKVQPDGSTYRLAVPGGWLYWHQDRNRWGMPAPAPSQMVYVPNIAQAITDAEAVFRQTLYAVLADFANRIGR